MQLHKDKLYSMKEVDSEAVMWLVVIERIKIWTQLSGQKN